jgi:hypothetical protein
MNNFTNIDLDKMEADFPELANFPALTITKNGIQFLITNAQLEKLMKTEGMINEK